MIRIILIGLILSLVGCSANNQSRSAYIESNTPNLNNSSKWLYKGDLLAKNQESISIHFMQNRSQENLKANPTPIAKQAFLSKPFFKSTKTPLKKSMINHQDQSFYRLKNDLKACTIE